MPMTPYTAPAITVTTALRGLARRRPRTHRPRPVLEFSCDRCHVAWAGPEADCWSCGLLATTQHTRYGAALQRLLDTTRHGKGAMR